jgi:chromate transporter
MTEQTEHGSAAPVTPRLADLFLGFSGIAIMGFGGVLPWARRMLVEERRWLSADEFAELLALCQFLPGGNIINLAVLVGQRTHGAAGALLSVAGLMAAPVIIVLFLGSVYLRFGGMPEVQHGLRGVAAAAAGLILAMAAKLSLPLFTRKAGMALAFAAAAFAGVALFRFSLPVVVLVLAPLSVAAAWRKAA